MPPRAVMRARSPARRHRQCRADGRPQVCAQLSSQAVERKLPGPKSGQARRHLHEFSAPRLPLGLIQELQPDILVAEFGDDESVALLRRARKLAPDLKVIVLSEVEAVEHVDATLAAGAVAYVLKTADPEDLALAIRQTFAQSVYFA